MPIKKCKTSKGTSGYKVGHGNCMNVSEEKAKKVQKAIYAKKGKK